MIKYRDKTTEASLARQRAIIEIAISHNQLPSCKDTNSTEHWCTVYKTFEKLYERVFNFEVRCDDVFLVGFMKCGNTWMNETLWQLLNCLDFHYERNKEDHFKHFLEFNCWYPTLPDIILKFDQLQGRRLMQTHLPASLLPKQLWEKKPKIVYVARNVKDVVVSAYHFMQWMNSYSGSMDEFVQDFMDNNIIYTSFWAHIVEFWKLRHEPYVFFITYEEMKRDLAGVIKKLCVFLEIPKLTEVELKKLVEHLSFEKMKVNKETNPSFILRNNSNIPINANLDFMRRGIVGSYKDELTDEHQCQLNEWSRCFLEMHGIKEEDIFGKLLICTPNFFTMDGGNMSSVAA